MSCPLRLEVGLPKAGKGYARNLGPVLFTFNFSLPRMQVQGDCESVCLEVEILGSPIDEEFDHVGVGVRETQFLCLTTLRPIGDHAGDPRGVFPETVSISARRAPRCRPPRPRAHAPFCPQSTPYCKGGSVLFEAALLPGCQHDVFTPRGKCSLRDWYDSSDFAVREPHPSQFLTDLPTLPALQIGPTLDLREQFVG